MESSAKDPLIREYQSVFIRTNFKINKINLLFFERDPFLKDFVIVLEKKLIMKELLLFLGLFTQKIQIKISLKIKNIIFSLLFPLFYLINLNFFLTSFI